MNDILKKRCWLVIGATGEYSDRTEWFIAAYTTREQADLHCRLLNDFVKDGPGRHKFDWSNYNKTPFDPNLQMDYTGTHYDVAEIPLVRHVDEFLEVTT